MDQPVQKALAKNINSDVQKTIQFYVYRKAPEKEFDQSDSFLVAMSPVATFVQFPALMPICGISRKDPKDLKFKWTSFRTIYTLLYITYGVFISIFFFTYIVGEGISAKNIGNGYEYNKRFVKHVNFIHYC